MAKIFIKVNGNWEDFGTVVNFTIIKKANLDITTMTGMDSDQTIADDFNGAERDFTINVVIQTSDPKTDINKILSLINGAQLEPYQFYVENFIGDQDSPINMKVNTIQLRYSEAQTGYIAYTLNLVEAML